ALLQSSSHFSPTGARLPPHELLTVLRASARNLDESARGRDGLIYTQTHRRLSSETDIEADVLFAFHSNPVGLFIPPKQSQTLVLDTMTPQQPSRSQRNKVVEATWLDIEIHPRAVEKLNEPVRALANSSRRERGRTEEERRSQGVLLGALTTARRKLATLKALQTTDFLQNIVDQGEKVVVFSAFMPPTLRFARHFGDAAVTITGGVPAAERQNRVDRFQEDDSVRVLAANLHVGGVGLNLTAARQVVFNDLDWTPANHWQAEDRAYRIGQTGTVNVTYMIGVGTVDEFVRTVLQRKARVIDDLVEGKALGSELDTDVLGELKRMLTAMPALASGDVDPARVTELLTQARAAYVAEQNPAGANTPARLPYSEEAVQALAAALSGPKRERYRAVSSSDASKAYDLEVIGADVSCSCRGFQYRGSCQHARKLKDAVAGDKALPKGFVRVTP
ncbi:MAG: helicase-related protein, partial [Candidatus Poribacteria bacterium]